MARVVCLVGAALITALMVCAAVGFLQVWRAILGIGQ